MEDTPKIDSEDTPIERAKENLKIQVELMRKAHEIGRKCSEFIAGEQWDQDEIIDREQSFRPIITINRLSNPVNVVVNKNAMEAARIKVIGFEDNDVDNARVKNGLLRHIQFSDKSDAIEAFSWAFHCLAVSGYGYWRVDAEYCDDNDFNQELVINKIEDQFSVYIDDDGMFAIIVRFMRKNAYRSKYGEGGSKNFGDAEIIPDHEDDIMVVEYWEKIETPVDLYQIQLPEEIAVEQGAVTDVDQAIEQQLTPSFQAANVRVITLTKDELEEQYPDTESYEILKTRKSKKVKIKQYVFSGDETLEENEWPGKYIPIVGIFSHKYKLRSGEYFYKPLVFDSLDPQRLYNFYRSQDAELMMLIPKSVWQGAEGQFEGHEDEYDSAHKRPTSRLEYKPTSFEGNLNPPPQRLPPPQVSQGYYQNITVAAEEIKATTGIFDPSLGAQGNEIAAKAILARQKQGDIGTFHFTAAINAGFIKTGIILLDQIPFRYDTARTIRIVGDDLADEVVKINQPFIDKNGKPQNYDMTSGSYDLKIETGSNTITRRQEALESLMELARVVPSFGQFNADMIVGNIDADKMDESADRMKAAISMQFPQFFQIVEQLKGGNPILAVQLQSAQQQIQKLVGTLQQLGKQNQQLQKQVQDNKVQEAQIDATAGIKEQQIRTAGDIQKEVIKGRFNQSMPRAAAPGGMRQ